MHTHELPAPDIVSTKEFPKEGLVKHFDDEGRLVKIEFLLSGKYCLIGYLPDGFEGHQSVRRIWWSDGHIFLTWKEDGECRYEHIQRPFTCEIPRVACCGECDRCSYTDHRTFYPAYTV